MDMTEIMARVQEMNAQRAEATAAKRIEVKTTLEAHGITAVSAEYDAYGDSGNIESVRWQGNRLNKLLTSCDFSESKVVRAPDFGDFACSPAQKSPARPFF